MASWNCSELTVTWLEYRWQAGIFSRQEQMQIIRCCHMKNYFNLKEYLMCILVLFTVNFSKHEEEAQPHQHDASKSTLGAEWMVLWHWIETKSSSWAEDLMDASGLIDILLFQSLLLSTIQKTDSWVYFVGIFLDSSLILRSQSVTCLVDYLCWESSSQWLWAPLLWGFQTIFKENI